MSTTTKGRSPSKTALIDGEHRTDLDTTDEQLLTQVAAILNEEDLYNILDAPRTSSTAELRRCYLERSKVLHPDKAPFHSQSTLAFQRIAFAFEILKTPSTRQEYDQRARAPSGASRSKNIGDDGHIRNVLHTLRHEFLTGTFATVREWLDKANHRYAHWFSKRVVNTIDRGLVASRMLYLGSRNYEGLLCKEIGRVNRVFRRFNGLEYTDVMGRVRVGGQLLQTVLAIPMRVAGPMKRQQEQRERGRSAGLDTSGISMSEASQFGGSLNETVRRFIEIIVGDAVRDDPADETR